MGSWPEIHCKRKRQCLYGRIIWLSPEIRAWHVVNRRLDDRRRLHKDCAGNVNSQNTDLCFIQKPRSPIRPTDECTKKAMNGVTVQYRISTVIFQSYQIVQCEIGQL